MKSLKVSTTHQKRKTKCSEFLHGPLTCNYDLSAFIIPHYKEYHETIAGILRNVFDRSTVRIADIGAGTGNLYTEIDNQITTNYVAIDNSAKMLKGFRNRAKSSSRLKVICSDALDYLKDTEYSFDVVINSWTFHNWDRLYRESVLTEVYRILKPGGLFISADKISPESKALDKAQLRWQLNQIRSELAHNEKLCESWIQHYLLDNEPQYKIYEKEYVSLLRRLEFKEIHQIRKDCMDMILLSVK